MTCFCCYPPLSDLSRKDGREDVGGKQSAVGGREKKRGGGGGACKEREMLLSPLSGLSIALSLPIRKLMQLSVLILESSFYSFSPPLLCNLFLFRSALICAVAADDKTRYIRLLVFFFPPFPFLYQLRLG